MGEGNSEMVRGDSRASGKGHLGGKQSSSEGELVKI